MTITGGALLALSMSAAVYVVLWQLFPHEVAVAVTSLCTALFAWLWFGLPLVRRMHRR